MNYSIIVPIFKEEKNIAKMIRKVQNELSKKKVNYELIFVDDDSQDESERIFKENKNKKTRFFIRKKKPRDLSKSVIFGLKKSKFNNLIVMDGDLQHNPKDINKLIRKFEYTNCDIVIGSRRLINYKKANLNPIRFFFSKFLNQAFNNLFNQKILDPMSGFFLIKKNIVKNVKGNLVLIGYKILIDIILSSNKKLNIKEVYINFRVRDKGFSKMRLKILLQLILIV